MTDTKTINDWLTSLDVDPGSEAEREAVVLFLQHLSKNSALTYQQRLNWFLSLQTAASQGELSRRYPAEIYAVGFQTTGHPAVEWLVVAY
jgi:hypothetical protein